MAPSISESLGFTGAPFHLDDGAVAWVERTLASLSVADKVRQIMIRLVHNGTSDEELIALATSGLGGASRFPNGKPQFLARSAELLRQRAAIPMLLSADFEFDEVGAIGGLDEGIRFPNQLAVAASDDPAAAGRMATVAAREARPYGFDWSFTPVADLSLNAANPLVVTRSFGDDVGRVRAFVEAYVRGMEDEGMATATKHFPGDGVDSRDQHTVPTRNSLGLQAWRSSYGEIFRAAITAGTRTVMAGHISLPAYVTDQGGTPEEAYLPATLSPRLLEGLLRRELGFAGLIVSDASEMGGFRSLGRREDIVPACIAAGCDMLLFDAPGDQAILEKAVEDGRLSVERLTTAVARVLALKASLGLHREVVRSALSAEHRVEHEQWRDEAARRAVVLVRDDDALLPLRPDTHKRIVLAMAAHRRNVFRDLPDLEIAALFRESGFEVVSYPEADLDPQRDVLVYVVADEAKQGKIHLRVDWTQLQPGFPRYMDRAFHDLPTMLISFGSPYAAFDAPQCRTIVNAHSPVPAVQRAVVAAVTGAQRIEGVSPVDPFAGLDEAETRSDQALHHANAVA